MGKMQYGSNRNINSQKRTKEQLNYLYTACQVRHLSCLQTRLDNAISNQKCAEMSSAEVSIDGTYSHICTSALKNLTVQVSNCQCFSANKWIPANHNQPRPNEVMNMTIVILRF